MKKTRLCACGCGKIFDVSTAKNCAKIYYNISHYHDNMFKKRVKTQAEKDDRYVDTMEKRRVVLETGYYEMGL